MSYTPYYPGGWQSGEEGGTPITPAALNNMETGIGAALTPSDVVNNLTSTATDKPLSANMGKTLNQNKQDKSSLFIYGSSDEITQTFDISNKGYENPIFMLTVGYSTKGMAAIIYLNAFTQTSIAFEKISGVGDINISTITYVNGTITVTFTSNPYRTARLIALNW